MSSTKTTLCSLPQGELEEIKNEIENITQKRAVLSEENFDKKIRSFMASYFEENSVRDWRVLLPDINMKHIAIVWNSFYNGTYDSSKYTYKLKMRFNNETVSIHKYVICTCFSPHFCSGNCYKNKDKIDCIVATYDVKNKTYEVNPDVEDNFILEWVSKVFPIYEPLYPNYENLYNRYFQDNLM